MTKHILCAALVVFAGCAAGPRPVPSTLEPVDRLVFAEQVLAGAKNAHATFELEATGENAAKMTGTLRLYEGNALHLQAEGRFKGEAVQVLLDSRDAEGTNRSLTRGAEVSSHRDPPAPHLREAVSLGLLRMGLLHNLVLLSLDRTVDHADGGFGGYVKAIAPHDGRSDTVDGQGCHRVDFGIDVDGRDMGEASVCIADATGLPLQRRSTVRFATGPMTLSETFKWELK